VDLEGGARRQVAASDAMALAIDACRPASPSPSSNDHAARHTDGSGELDPHQRVGEKMLDGLERPDGWPNCDRSLA